MRGELEVFLIYAAIGEANAAGSGIQVDKMGPGDIHRFTDAISVDDIARRQGRGALVLILPELGYLPATSYANAWYARTRDARRASPSRRLA